MRLGLGAAMAGAAVMVAASGAAQPFTRDEQNDFIQALGFFEKVVARKADLWPGFDPGAAPVAIYRPRGKAIVVGHPNPGTGPSMPTGGRPARIVNAPPDWFGGGPAQLGDVVVARLDPGYVGEEGAATIFGALVGEAFKAHQIARGAQGWPGFGRQPEPEAVFAYPDDSAENDAGLELESILLEQTLRSEPLAHRDRARELCALRQERRAKIGAGPAKFEDDVEIAGGLPLYAGLRALRAAAADGLVAPAEAQRAVEALVGRASPEPGARVADRIRRSAARIALLLEAMGLDWRPAANDGQTLDEALRKAAGACAGAQAARQRLGWPALFAEAQRRVREEWKRRELTWGQVEAAGGIGVVAVDMLPFPDGGVQRIDYTTAERTDAGRRLHQRLRAGLGRAGELQYDVAVAETRATRRYAARMPKDVKVVVDGADTRLDFTADLPFLEAVIYGTGLQLTFHGGLMRVESGGVVVRPFPRGLAAPPAAPAAAAPAKK